jgi:subtilisin
MKMEMQSETKSSSTVAVEANERQQTICSPQITQQFEASGVAQVIVVLKRGQVAVWGQTASAAMGVGKGGVDPLAKVTRHFVSSDLSQSGAIISAMSVPPGAATAKLAATRGGEPAASVLPFRLYRNLGVIVGNVTPAGLSSLADEGDVASVTGAPIMTLISPQKTAATKLRAQTTWGLDALGVSRLWLNGITGEGIVVAHLDTGVDGNHPALQGAIASFAEFNQLGDEVIPVPKPHDTGEHGTHTAATIVGRAVKGLKMGVAPGARLASAIVIEGGNVVLRVLAGLNWALDKDVKVLSMSLGLPGWVNDFLPIIQILRERAVLPVIAVGNEGPGTSRSPGNYVEVLSVGAADKNLRVASFSSSQKFARRDSNVPDLVAPGVDVISAVPRRQYATKSGTSMAAPHIAGLAALLFQAKPGATIDEVENAIFRSCTLAPGMLPAEAGRGFPNAVLAYEVLTGRKLTSVVTSGKARLRRPPKALQKVTPRKKIKARGKAKPLR